MAYVDYFAAAVLGKITVNKWAVNVYSETVLNRGREHYGSLGAINTVSFKLVDKWEQYLYCFL